MPKMKRKAATQKKPSSSKRQKISGDFTSKKKKAVSLAPELKYHDVTVNADASTTATIVSLGTFAAGDTALLRDGNKVIYKSLDLRIVLGNEALTEENIVRFVVVQSKNSATLTPAWTDVFDAETIQSRRLVNSATRFQIIADEVVHVKQRGSTGGSLCQAHFRRFIKMPAVVTTWADATSTVASTNAYFLMYVGNVASGVTDCNINGTARVRFQG